MRNQKIDTTTGAGLIVIIAVSVLLFFWIYEQGITSIQNDQMIKSNVTNVNIIKEKDTKNKDPKIWNSYIPRSESVSSYTTVDWNSFSKNKDLTEPGIEITYPGNWEVDVSILYDENKKKIAELSPGTVILEKNQHCFDKKFTTDRPELIQLLSEEKFKIGTNTGVKRLMKSYIDGGPQPNIWFPNTYCVESKDRAFVITFYEFGQKALRQEIYNKIISSVRFLY